MRNSSVENMISGLNESSLLKQVEEIARGYRIDVVRPYQSEACHVAVFVNEHRFCAGVSKAFVIHHLESALLTQAAPALLVGIVGEILLGFSICLRRDNSNDVAGVFGPLHDIVSAWQMRIANGLEVNTVGKENRDSWSG